MIRGRRAPSALTKYAANADIIDGPRGRRLVLSAPDAFKAAMRRMSPGPKIVTVKPYVEARSSWKRFYWGIVVDIIAEHCGYTKDETHEALKLKFLGLEPPDDPSLDVSVLPMPHVPKVRSTSSLDDAGWRRYVEDIRIFAAQELECVIPEKGEQ